MSVYKKLLSNFTVSRDVLVRRIVISFVFAFTVINVIIYLSWTSFTGLQENGKMVEHTHIVLNEFDQLFNSIVDAEASVRGYVITNDSSFLQSFYPDRDSSLSTLTALQKLTRDNPSQVSRVNKLDSLIKVRFALLSEIITRKKAGEFFVDDHSLVIEGKKNTDKIKTIIFQARDEETTLMKTRNEAVQRSTWQSGATIVIFSLVVLAIIFASLVLVLSELRKRSALEELLKSVLNASLNGIQTFESVHDESGKIVDFKYIQANEVSYKMIGGVQDSYVGKSLLKIVPAIKADGLFTEFIKVVETGNSLDIEHYFHGKEINGWYHMAAVKMRDGFTLTFDDITKAKQTELDLENNLDALRRSNAELEQFAYVASHDLQEPLRKILAFIDRLKERGTIVLNEEGKNYLERIVNSAQRMRTLINDLLSYSRVGSVLSVMTPVDLNKVLTETLSDLEVVIQQKNAVITCSELPVIEGVEIQLRQLFQNLVSNALKFSEPARPSEIDITSEYVNASEEVLIGPVEPGSRIYSRIYFTDNGVGFDEKYAEKIFQIFQRLYGKNEYEGTGIGLAICKKIVENHHGTIIAHGKEGRGATFILSLPLKQNPIK